MPSTLIASLWRRFACHRSGLAKGAFLMEEGSVQKSPFSGDAREPRDSEILESPKLWKTKESPTIF